ncbi:hypothetical protein ACI3LZ_003009 [Candidozyma auris]
MIELGQQQLLSSIKKVQITHQEFLDRSVPYVTERWICFSILLLAFVLRIVFSHGWYIICYALGIYLLNLFLAFLTPKFDPSLEQESRSSNLEEGGDEVEDEFRPFIRRLPEFKFWVNASRATVASLGASLFPIFDIPVFWPILVMQDMDVKAYLHALSVTLFHAKMYLTIEAIEIVKLNLKPLKTFNLLSG